MKIIIALTAACFVVVARASGGCTDEGNNYNNGDVVTKGCFVFHCTDGSIVFDSGKCTNTDGSCVAVGDEVKNPCSTLKCIVDNVDGGNVYKFETVTHRCIINGKCIEVGQKEGCFTCLAGGEVGKKCNYGNVCHDPGTQINACASCNADGTLDKTDGCPYKSKDGTETCATHGNHGVHAFDGVDYDCTCTVENNSSSSKCASMKR